MAILFYGTMMAICYAALGNISDTVMIVNAILAAGLGVSFAIRTK